MAVFEGTNLRIEKPSDHFAMLVVDVAGRNANVFNRQVLADLEAGLERLAADSSIQLLGIRSATPSKPFAGADLNEFATWKSAEEAVAISALGQRVFDKLTRLPMTTIIVIQGPCLGGGLEFALACDYRLVLDQPKTQLGLPEVELGLIPGWGGTQRLPRRIGLERALHIILGGRRLTAREAFRWRLADGIAAGEDYATELRRLGHRAVRKGKRPAKDLPLFTWRQRLLESNPLGRSLLMRGTNSVLHQRVPDDMPAPAEAMKAVRVGLTRGMEAGLACEREAIGRLATSSACRNLVNLFLEREQARKAAEKQDDSVAKISRVGIVGAGTMGAGIAQLAAVRGLEVTIQEVSEAALAAGMERIADLFQKAAQRRVLSQEEAEQKLAAIRRTITWEGFGEVDLVVEAVLEELSLKQAVFRSLEQHTRPTIILATNTSSLLVQQLQDGLQHPERVAGLHFFNPVHKMPLVEVVRAPWTGESAVGLCAQWAVALGKTPVIVKDSPGFVVNRILMPYLDEAVRLVAEGIPIEGVDQVMRRFGMPMGPLELLDQVGLDVAAHVARAMKPVFGDRLPPNPAFEQMCARGWLGQKTGTGFYRYRGKAKKTNSAAAGLVSTERKASGPQLLAALPPAVQAREERDRMVLLMVNEAAACVDEGLTANAQTIDLALVLGTGWAPHRGGPLRYAHDRGLSEVVQALRELAQRYGPRFEPGVALRRAEEETRASGGRQPPVVETGQTANAPLTKK